MNFAMRPPPHSDRCSPPITINQKSLHLSRLTINLNHKINRIVKSNSKIVNQWSHSSSRKRRYKASSLVTPLTQILYFKRPCRAKRFRSSDAGRGSSQPSQTPKSMPRPQYHHHQNSTIMKSTQQHELCTTHRSTTQLAVQSCLRRSLASVFTWLNQSPQVLSAHRPSVQNFNGHWNPYGSSRHSDRVLAHCVKIVLKGISRRSYSRLVIVSVRFLSRGLSHSRNYPQGNNHARFRFKK